MKRKDDCERQRRSDGFGPMRSCRVCHLGPCVFGIGEPVIIDEAGTVTPEMWASLAPRDFWTTNRLHGAAINEHGEAV